MGVLSNGIFEGELPVKIATLVLVILLWLASAAYIGGRAHFTRLAAGRESVPSVKRQLQSCGDGLVVAFFVINALGIFSTICTVRWFYSR